MGGGLIERIYRVEAPHFCAGLVVVGGRVTEAAPELEWALGWEWMTVYAACAGWGWGMRLVLRPVIEPVWMAARRLAEEGNWN